MNKKAGLFIEFSAEMKSRESTGNILCLSDAEPVLNGLGSQDLRIFGDIWNFNTSSQSCLVNILMTSG